MTRFNKASIGTKTVNLAGGHAYTESTKLELLSLLFTSFLKNQFYRSADDAVVRIKELIAQEKDKKFVAKAALFARNELGMRSVSHLVASEIAKQVKGESWSKTFFEKIVHRTDDMTEILACYAHTYGKPIPNAMKKGFARVLENLNEYNAAKYRMDGKDVTLIDVVNLVHPKGTPVLAKLMKGELKNTETWESVLSDAGQGDGDVDENKSKAWSELLKEKKLGYLALLRNLRNIIENAPESVPLACEQLLNKEAIQKSLVLPFRFVTAIEQIEEMNGDGVRSVLIALSQAVDLALSNVPKFDGKTLVVMDASGSMSSVMDKASIFAATLYKACDADMMLFSEDAKYLSLNPTDSTLSIAKTLRGAASGVGTNFLSIFETANRAYDRVVILSDMQGWMGGTTPAFGFSAYKTRTGANPHVFSFDLAGYGSIQFPEQQVYCIAGFSDKILGVMQLLEKDKKALENAVNAIDL